MAIRPLLAANALAKAFDSRSLFEGLTFGIQEGERLGLIGPNGSGKSTLLRIIARQVEADGGDLVFRKNVKISYLEQNPVFRPNASVMETLMEGAPDPEDWSYIAQADELLWKLNLQSYLKAEDSVDRLSGGLKKRLAVAREIMRAPDLFLLDEPTNHLDVEGILWLEDVLRETKAASVVVTHDRLFLDRVSNRILELDRRNPGGLLSVEGNYSRYLEVKASLVEAQENRETILRGILRRESEWLRAGVKAQRSKQFARIQRHAELEAETKSVAQRNIVRTAQMEVQDVGSTPKRLLEAKKISKSYPDRGVLFSNLDLLLTPGARLGLLGANGSGKSTLIRILLDEEKPDSGHIQRSDQLKVAYFEQNREKLDPELSLMKTVCPHGDGVFYQGRSIHIRTYLDRFLFTQDQMDLPVGKLSGGEQSRVVLAKLMLIPCNLLVMDEPTNDLDIATLNVLQDCLLEFEGAVVLVSHDRYFLDQVSTEILAFPELERFADLAQWEAWHAAAKPKPKQRPSNPKPAPVVSKTEDTKETQRLMRRIEQLELKYAQLEEECGRPEVASDLAALTSRGKKMTEIQAEIADLYTEWSRL